MMVSVARSAGDARAGHAVQLIPQSSSGPCTLAYDVHLAAGVHVSVDLMTPDRWQSVSLPGVTDVDGPLLRCLIGAGAADRVRAGGRRGFAVDPVSAAPWLRIAFVDALDRWLQAPLDQSLVDAERGVSRGSAARTLPPGQARALLVGDALQLARRASNGFATFLRGLARRSEPIPGGLVLACCRLVDGYKDLRGEVAGPDRELTAVIRAWRRFSSRIEEAGRKASGARCPEATPWAPPHTHPQRTSVIDPRQVPARVFALAADPAAAELEVRIPDRADGDAVVVRAPAFGPAVDPDTRSRLVVRLVERRSATPRGHALLDRAGRHFEATVPLCGLSASDVRADVFDALSGVPAAATDNDRGLQEARRAVVFLAEWRRLAALAHLPVAVTEPARRLRDLAARLHPHGGAAGDPVFAGGPSAVDLNELADVGETRLLRRLRGVGGPPATTGGSARLLMAEIAAAHREPGASPE
ncbi:hypothetical protein [Pseudonocardia sp. DLS-67]